MQPIALFCCHFGIRIIFYLNDSLIMAHSSAEALAHRDFVLSLLKHLGFLVNLQKSDLSPIQQLTFLGIQWDNHERSMGLTEEKVVKLQRAAHQLLISVSPFVWDLQKFLGLSNFAVFTVSRAHLCSCYLQRVLFLSYKSPSDRFRSFALSRDARQELEWWVSIPSISKTLGSTPTIGFNHH